MVLEFSTFSCRHFSKYYGVIFAFS